LFFKSTFSNIWAFANGCLDVSRQKMEKYASIGKKQYQCQIVMNGKISNQISMKKGLLHDGR